MALNFELTPEQMDLKKEVAELGKKYNYLVEPCDRESTVPHLLHEEMGKRNWIVPFVPVQYGGMGKGAIEFAIITEELGRAGFMGPNPIAQVSKSILARGTERQKKYYLPKFCSGEFIAAVAISEPHAGTNWDLMKTVAAKKEGGYVLDGEKAHINYAMDAQVLMVYAKTGKGISVFLVPSDGQTASISFKKGDPIGLRMEPIADIFFVHHEMDENALLGEEGKALEVFIAAFNLSRIGNASRLIGIGRGALDAAVHYAREREVSGSKVTDFQGIRWIVAELYSRIETAVLMRDKAAWKLDAGSDPALEVAMAKMVAASVAEEVISKAFSLTGAWGLYRGAPFERFWRDAMVGRVGGGSIEMLKNFIARRVLGKPQSTRGVTGS